MYDITAGSVQTPQGIGKFVEFIGHTGKVLVEMDYSYIVEFDAGEVYIDG
ncbi:MAG: hypothetical protein QMD71_06420 [bacterium]|nr:hypothetical protein [bacterium]